MNLLDFKEKISRMRFFIDKIKYSRKRHFYFIVPGFIFLITISFIVIFINQQLEIKRKDNILKSYYSGYDEAIVGIESGGESGSEIRLKTGGESIESYSSADLEERENSEVLLQSSDIIKVYVCGEVKNPGVYDVVNGARVIDVLELAGGKNEDACLEIINLAESVFDGQRIYIPSMEEVSSSDRFLYAGDYSGNQNYLESRTVNINKADLKELQSLPGIGPVTAKSIVDFRNKNGLFKVKEEIKNVTGIGEKKYEKIKQFISI